MSSPELVAETPPLKMVLIRATATEVRQLRTMPLDIVRIRPVPAPEMPTKKADFLNQEFVVEAVAPAALAAKLRHLGFDITEVR